MNEYYQPKLDAFIAQAQYRDEKGHYYKRVNGQLWVLKYGMDYGYRYKHVCWSKVEDESTIMLSPTA